MTQLGGNKSTDLNEIRKKLSIELKKNKIQELDATMKVTGGDFLDKIWNQILSVPFGIAITGDKSCINLSRKIFEKNKNHIDDHHAIFIKKFLKS